MEEKKIEEIIVMCSPIVSYMKRNCSPHDTIVITDEQVRMVADEFSVPVTECERS